MANNNSDGRSIVGSTRLPYFFQFFFVVLPFVFFLFEFHDPPQIFTDYQYYAIGFLFFSYILAIASLHKSLARIVAIIVTILVLPVFSERLLATFFGTLPFVNPDVLYYGAGYIAVITGFLYLSKSGFPSSALYGFVLKGSKNIAITMLFSLISAVVLLVYFRLQGSGIAYLSRNGFPQYLAIVTAFAVANGFMEELWFRGLLQSVFARSFTLRFAVIYQALLFGIIHYDGTPSGPVGIGLAFVFGLALGWLTARTGSILPAIIVHIIADFVIGLHL